MDEGIITGGCLCGALRYTARATPEYAGLCYCADCRKASGSGFIPFMGFSATALQVTGAVRPSRSIAIHGGEAVRNHCALCGSLVFGGILGESEMHTVYAGSLDDPGLFHPHIAIFVSRRPDWAILPPGLREFALMPEGAKPPSSG